MLDTPRIIQTTPQLYAYLHLSDVTWDAIGTVMGPGLNEVHAALKAQGIEPAGPWFTHHLRRPTDTFDFEICVPVGVEIVPEGRVKPGVWPAMTVARTVYSGPYEGLGEAWGEFIDWIETQGREPAPDLWERYLAGPEAGCDAALWRTELNRPLVG